MMQSKKQFKTANAHPNFRYFAEIYQALVVATRDYVQRSGFPGGSWGLSGGIDSALTLCYCKLMRLR